LQFPIERAKDNKYKSVIILFLSVVKNSKAASIFFFIFVAQSFYSLSRTFISYRNSSRISDIASSFGPLPVGPYLYLSYFLSKSLNTFYC